MNRGAQQLYQYPTCKIVYKEGLFNVEADCLSRHPITMFLTKEEIKSHQSTDNRVTAMQNLVKRDEIYKTFIPQTLFTNYWNRHTMTWDIQKMEN